MTKITFSSAETTNFDRKGMKFLKKNKFAVLGVLLGLAAGYAYYHFVGCSNGSCSITSKPLNSALYGGLMGGLLLSFLDGFIEKRRNKSEEA